MLSTADVAAMRSTLDASLPDSGEVHRRTSVSDGAGGTTEIWAPVGTFAVRVSPVSRIDRLAERIVAGELVAIGYWTLTFATGTDVTERDRVFVGSRQFEVTLVLAPRSWEVGRRVLASEVE